MSILRPLASAALCLLLLPSQPARTEQGSWGSMRNVAAPSPRALWQGGEPEEEVGQVKARKLAGYVHMAIQKDTALAQVLVEECDRSWSRVLASTKTDFQGHFNLKPGRRGKVHYLRLTAKGFGTRLYQVTLSPDAPPELMLELRLASKSQDGPSRQLPGNSYAGRGLAAAGMS